MPTTPTATDLPTTEDLLKDFHRLRGLLAEQTRRGVPGDPRIDRTRGRAMRIQELTAESSVLDHIELRRAGADPAEAIRALSVKGVPTGVTLLAACSMLATLIGLADDPDALVGSLREAVANGRNTPTN
ncbi:hypothetical protein MMUR_22180 [Mycolicibacterium murale]|uniref:Uncharacterized protein n=1 Tax=Mycolicibacterium murale TaxID=182220 RepID=A0A7I9WK00_9MYCO|nr:hypothetical protein [Mycolicibacterium murale]MCV7185581.1 hypothetical protein [Mycolicibacterium murale]GFG58082.1 hypothetical protein MMUR_22180 [Mycolicibacterium murale]